MNSFTTLARSVDALSPEVRLFAYAASLYVTFIIWGYLQERITTATYTPSGGSDVIRWNFPFVLNLCMAGATYLAAHVIESFNKKQHAFPKKFFWRPALAATLASPLGYASLKYINYPFMVLTKSSKPVPIMVIGSVFFGQKYPWFKYVSVAMLCIGISTFTLAQTAPKGKAAESAGFSGLLYSLYGVVLILLNLAMDGYTNNEQDRLYKEMPLSATQMMKQTNYWQCIFQAVVLIAGLVVLGRSSELIGAVGMLSSRPSLMLDIVLFCTCATAGQLLIFRLIKEYGSLVWVTISVTRQLFTILLSVLLFGHHVNLAQWMGVVLVFSGLGTDILFTFLAKLRTDRLWDGRMQTLPDAVMLSLGNMAKVNDKDKAGGSSRGFGFGTSATGRDKGAGGVNSAYSAYRPGFASRSSSAEYVDIEQQLGRGETDDRPLGLAPSPGAPFARKTGSGRWVVPSGSKGGAVSVGGVGSGVGINSRGAAVDGRSASARDKAD